MNKSILAKITVAGFAAIAVGAVLKKLSERIKRYGEVKISESK